MDLKPFNEILKDIEGQGSRNNNSASEELAQKLYSQGIASSLMEAREKARSMINTERTVRNEFSDKKEELTQYNDPRNNPSYNPYKAAMVEEMRQRALDRRPIAIQTDFQTPGFDKKEKK